MYKCSFLILFSICFKLSFGQTSIPTDELFKQARSAAFDQKNYALAISLSKQALTKSPDYADISIFLGRIYTWTGKTDSARQIFTGLLDKHPELEDASFAYASLEYWNDNSVKALQIVDNGIKYHPQSKDMLLLKGKILNDLHRFKAADSTLNILIKADPSNSAARSIDNEIKDNATLNKLSVSYDYIYFDKEFGSPWQVAEVDYTRQTSLGSIIGTLNYANRFNTNGLQFEVDAYPHISKIFYAYASVAYAGNVAVFPKARGGFSLYANLPNSFEAELGFRYLYFTGSTWIYTAAIGKYYKNFRFTLRTYLTPSFGSVSQSYSLNTRLYTGGQFDYFSFTIGTGISPDDPRNIILLNNGNNYKLSSDNVAAAYYRTYKRNVFFVNATLENQEYRFETRGNQLDIGIGYQRRF